MTSIMCHVRASELSSMMTQSFLSLLAAFLCNVRSVTAASLSVSTHHANDRQLVYGFIVFLGKVALKFRAINVCLALYVAHQIPVMIPRKLAGEAETDPLEWKVTMQETS